MVELRADGDGECSRRVRRFHCHVEERRLCRVKPILQLIPYEEVLCVGNTARQQYSPSYGRGIGFLEMALNVLMVVEVKMGPY